ncbi:MAG: right-handed parallel beta-helix repeat-containing protein [Deltaproteobacteria bacterium]|nr:right-handed parallel beta-helix repeat-containing protein [Deltaproteobacteria bacterium]
MPRTGIIIVLTLLSISGVKAFADELTVPEQFKTIQDAVNSAKPNDVITVKAGTYSENIAINKPLTLISHGGADSVNIVAAKEDEPVIIITGANVAVTGFTLTGSAIAGIVIKNTADARIRGNKSLHNKNGILIYSSKGNSLTGNIASFNNEYGIYLENSSFNKIAGNSAGSNNDKGVFLSSSSSNTITGNSINLNTWNGLMLVSSHKNIIKDNKTLRNTFGISLTDSNDNELENNSTWPNLFIILPVLLIYAGIVLYLIQRTILRIIYRYRTKSA